MNLIGLYLFGWILATLLVLFALAKLTISTQLEYFALAQSLGSQKMFSAQITIGTLKCQTLH